MERLNVLLNKCVKSSAILAATLPLVLSGCQDEEFGYSKYDVMDSKYAKEFADSFGDIDPNHTWNTATRASIDVEINFDGAYTVKVYTANPRYPENNSYLVGQFDNVETGAHNFLCDMPSTVECAYVGLIDYEGNRIIEPAPLTMGKSSVVFGIRSMSQTRAVYTGNSPFIYSEASKQEWTLTDLKAPLQTLPEGVNNTGKVAQNFEYVSMGEFTIYPIYSITSNHGEGWGSDFGEKLGIYTYDSWGNVNKNADGTPVVTPIWHMNRGGLTSDNQWNGTGTWYEAHNVTTNEWQQMIWFAQNVAGANETNTVWDDPNSTMRSAFDKIRSAGIRLQIPEGTRFGFALLTDHGYIYSNSLYNKDEGGVGPSNTAPDHIRDTYAATFHDGGNLYLAFEDWGYGAEGHDTDFNDLVLRLLPTGGYNPLIIDKDIDANPILYIVACEDLGGTFDWDFNDVVFGIEHVSGQTEARIKLLAAGGTLPVSLKFYHNSTENDITFGTHSLTDLHAAFGANTEQPVNVDAVGGVDREAIYSNVFSVDANTFNIHDDAKNFRINVQYKDGTSEKNIHIPDFEDKYKAPQAFLISDPTWKWPIEHQNITEKYSDFATWAHDLKSANNWANTSWGLVRENGSIPSYAYNILTQFHKVLTFSGNTVTFPLNKEQMGYDHTYKLVVMVTAEGTATFTDGNGNSFTTLADGSLTPNRYITFTFNPEAVKAIKDSGKDGLMTITFANGVNAEQNLKALFWYEAGAKPNPNLAITSSSALTLKVGDTAQAMYVTDNQETGVMFTSSNPAVATVDQHTGLISAVSVGDATISVTQPESEHFSTATAVSINVRVMNESLLTLTTPTISISTFDDDNQKTAQIGYTTQNNVSAVLFTSIDESIATVDNSGVVTAKKSGTTTIKVRQSGSEYFLEDEKEVKVTVNYRDGYGWRVVFNNADNRTDGRSEETWKSIGVGNNGGIKEVLGWNVSGGVKIIFDYDGIYGINDFYIQSRKSETWTVQLKGNDWMNGASMDNARKLSYTISEQDFNNNFQSSDNTWYSNLFFGGWTAMPKAVYVDHAQ